MFAELAKQEASVTLTLKIEILATGVIEQSKTRITKIASTKKSHFPPASYAPMSAEEKAQQLVDLALQDGYSLTKHTGELNVHTYSFLVEIDIAEQGRLEAIASSFGSPLQRNPNNINTLPGLDFTVVFARETIRATANINAFGLDEMALMRAIAFTACLSLHGTASITDSTGSSVDPRKVATSARIGGDLPADLLELLYHHGVFRRPLVIQPRHEDDRYAVTF